MTESMHLSKAPITEAILDIRIKIKDSFDVDRLQSLHESIKSEYPIKETRQQLEGKLEIKKGQPPKSTGSQKIIGYWFLSADRKQIFQARLDGFTFNRLSPYETWSSFRSEALRLWQLFSGLVEPEIIRVAVRFINKFNVPLPIKDFDEYLTAAPIVPKELPQAVSSFLTRTVIPFPDIESSLILTMVFEQLEIPQYLPLILDIDVSRMDSRGINEKDAWLLLEKFHDIKNQAFFASITPKTRELFE